MEQFSGKNQFPRINCDTLRFGVTLNTAANAQKEGAPIRLTGDEAAELISSANTYPSGFILQAAKNINDNTRCTAIPYEGGHEILGVADDAVTAGTLVSVIGWDATEGKGIYAAAQNGNWVCGIVERGGGAGEVITIITKSPTQYAD